MAIFWPHILWSGSLLHVKNGNRSFCVLLASTPRGKRVVIWSCMGNPKCLLQNPHAGLTALGSPLHQISPGHTHRKLRVLINQVFPLWMLIFCDFISPFCSFSCSEPGKENALGQREWFLHCGVIWHSYEPKPCVPLLPLPWCVPTLYQSSSLHCSRLERSQVNVRQGPFQQKLDWRLSSGCTPVSFHPWWER